MSAADSFSHLKLLILTVLLLQMQLSSSSFLKSDTLRVLWCFLTQLGLQRQRISEKQI